VRVDLDTMGLLDLDLGLNGGTIWWVACSRTGGAAVGLKPFGVRATLIVGDTNRGSVGSGFTAATIQAADALSGSEDYGQQTLIPWTRLDLHNPGAMAVGPWPYPESVAGVQLRALFRAYEVAQIGNVDAMITVAGRRET
jgi:hypothetical protein